VPWRLLPARELGCGSGVTCWRRLRDWQAAGVWKALHHRLLDWLGRRQPGRLVPGRHRHRERAGPTRGELVGANPVDRGKPGSKYHLLIDATGLPLAVGLSAANTHDSQLLQQLVDAVPAVIGPRGRLGRQRWKVERSLAWLLANRRLTVRYERRADLLTAFLHLACALLCARRLSSLPAS
jgi:transposase